MVDEEEDRSGEDREPVVEQDYETEHRVGRARENTISFEAVKSHWRQTKEGMALTLNLNPVDAPPEIILAHIGQRFMCVLVPLDQHEEPQGVIRPRTDGQRIVQHAGMICESPAFQEWLCQQGLADELDEEAAAVAVRHFCGIASRRELATDPTAARKFRQLYDAFSKNQLL